MQRIGAIVDCDFDNPAMTCPRCGFKAGARNWRKNCKGPPGLGDRVAAFLGIFGITFANVTKAKQLLGLKPCKCPKRQAALNRAGEKLRQLVRGGA